MPDDPRVHRLLEELLATGSTPEEVCRSCVELLPAVRERWRQVVRMRAELDDLFPPEAASTSDSHGTLRDIPLPEIPGYEIEGVIGSGGMGVVFKARHTRLNRVVALKMTLGGEYAGPGSRERFQREAEAIAALRHPNVVQIHNVGDADGRPYLTMEYVEGGTLAEKLSGTPLPARDAAALVAALAGAVQAAHAGGIVHRDLKPANVLLTADGVPKVGDFGLARRLGGDAGLTRTGAGLGTPSYMAPEQARGAVGAAGPPADVYALGAILYECLTGRPPFRAESAAETVHQLLTQDPVPPSRLNARVLRDLETICLKCLGKEPRHRYATAAALEEDLRRFLRGDPVQARPESRTRRLVRAVRRRPTLAVGATAAVLITLLALAVGSWVLFERAVAEQAVAGDLTEAEEFLRASSWTEARAAIERGEFRLGTRESPALRRRLNHLRSEWELADRLERIYVDWALTAGIDGDFTQADRDYDETFRGYGIGHTGDDPEAAAARVRGSTVRAALLAALDRWSVAAGASERSAWVLKVAGEAEPSPSPWRQAARNPSLRSDRAAVVDLLKTAHAEDESPALLLSLSLSLVLSYRQTDPAVPQEPAGALIQSSRQQVPLLTAIQQAHPGDVWANFYLGGMLLIAKRPDDASRYFQAVIALRPRLAIGYHYLGMALSDAASPRPSDVPDTAVVQFRRALEIDPNSALTHYYLIRRLGNTKRHTEAIAQAEVALRLSSRADREARIRTQMGVSLTAAERTEEALDQFRRAASLSPEDSSVRTEYRKALVRACRWDELRPFWGKVLEGNRPDHADWYGYAELCAYLGQEGEYRVARKALLDRFGKSDSPQVAERVARASLVAPASGEELKTAVALAAVAGRADPKQAGVLYPYYQFAKGLAEYRQGDLTRAIATLRGDASRMTGPLPQLVLAMASHRAGQETEARRTFVAAILAHEWREGQGDMPDGWIRQVLRREAEKMIFPDLGAVFEGKRRPRDNEERLALIGVCRFEGRFATLAGIYADAIASDPKLADDQRVSAARVAVQAGCGAGTDAGVVSGAERGKWRARARDWLREDLSVKANALSRDVNKSRESVRQALAAWRTEPELAGIRDPEEVAKLPPNEQAECRRLWDEVSALVESAARPK